MSDLAFIFREPNGPGDLRLDGPDLESGKELETAVIISLFSDARALEDDEFDGDDPKGWWGDTYLENQSDKIGSRLWLLAREKETDQTLNRARQYAQESLAWMVEDGVVSEVVVEAKWVRKGVLGLEIIIHRPGVNPARFAYKMQWDQINAL